MRIAILSDIHANLPALERVLEDIDQRDVDKILCNGDMIGYGPYPQSVMDLLHARGAQMLLGNHEAACVDLMDVTLFRHAAAWLINWTQEHVSPDDLEEIRNMPYIIEGNDMVCVHCDMVAPEEFHYLEDEENARETWDHCKVPVVFVGHTHVPRVHELRPDGQYQIHLPHPMRLQAGSRYIINTGSVGLSRDGDYRACYVIFDDEKRTVQWYRVPYDLLLVEAAAQDAHGSFSQVAYLRKQYDEQGPDEVNTLIEMDEIPDKLMDEETVAIGAAVENRYAETTVVKKAPAAKKTPAVKEAPAAKQASAAKRASGFGQRQNPEAQSIDSGIRSSVKLKHVPEGTKQTRKRLFFIPALLGLLVLSGIAVAVFLSSGKKNQKVDPADAPHTKPERNRATIHSLEKYSEDFERNGQDSLIPAAGLEAVLSKEQHRFGDGSLMIRSASSAASDGAPEVGRSGATESLHAALSFYAPLDEVDGNTVTLLKANQQMLPAGKVLGDPAWVAGKYQNALLCDSGLSHANLGTVWKIKGGMPYSISLWVYPIEGERIQLFSTMQTTQNDSAVKGMKVDLQNGQIRVRLESGKNQVMEIRGKGTLPMEQWSHLGFTQTGSHKAKQSSLFVNGRPTTFDIRSDTATPHVHSGAQLRIGQQTKQSDNRCIVDEIAVFSRILNEDQLQRVMNARLLGTLNRESGPSKTVTPSGTGDADPSSKAMLTFSGPVVAIPIELNSDCLAADISFWVSPRSEAPISVQLQQIGSNGTGKELFKATIPHGEWRRVNTQVNLDSNRPLRLIISGEADALFLDQLEVECTKTQ